MLAKATAKIESARHVPRAGFAAGAALARWELLTGRPDSGRHHPRPDWIFMDNVWLTSGNCFQKPGSRRGAWHGRAGSGGPNTAVLQGPGPHRWTAADFAVQSGQKRPERRPSPWIAGKALQDKVLHPPA